MGLISNQSIDNKIIDFLISKNLTKYEAETAFLAYRGYSNLSISHNYFITEKTVKDRMQTIYKKLEINTRADLIYLIHQKQLFRISN